jgi:putative transposase
VQARQRTHRFSLQEGRWGRKENPRHDWQSLSHVRWECKYHVVIIPKYRKRVFYGKLRRQLGPILREVWRQKGIELLEGHCMPEHVHLCLEIPPQYSVAYTLGYLKGKSAVRIPRELLQERRMTGLPFWAAGYCVSTVGLEEARVRQYLREQEEIEQRQGEFHFD